MSQEAVQVLEIAVLSACFLVLIIVLSLKQRLTFRYTLGWFVVFIISGTAGLLVPLVSPIADLFQVSRLMVFIALVIIVLLLISIQLSISISGLQRQVQDLTETIAILTARDRRETSK